MSARFYVVGGAVRDGLLGLPASDRDWVAVGVTPEELVAQGFRPVGKDFPVFIHPHTGEEVALARTERKTGRGYHGFAFHAAPEVTLEDDLARRDLTINAIAQAADGSLVDPFGGVADLERRQLRTVGPTSFDEDPLRLVRALRFVSQLGFDLAPETEAQMRVAATGLAHVSAERIGGGIKADGMGELSKLLLGREPGRALKLARDTGVLTQLIPEFEPAIGYRLATDRQPLSLEEHVFAVVQNAAAAGSSLEVRLAALLHDLGKPVSDGQPAGPDHASVGAALADRALKRLRYPTRVRHHVVRIVAAHGFTVDRSWDARDARCFLAEHGDELAAELIEHRAADLSAKKVDASELAALEQLRELVRSESLQPHRISDLAVTGDDLLELGFREGPELGRLLQALLEDVVDDPARNDPAWLLERAARELA